MPGMIPLQKRFLDDKDLAYRDDKGERQVLQVYTPDRGWQVPHHFAANEALRPPIEEFKGTADAVHVSGMWGYRN